MCLQRYKAYPDRAEKVKIRLNPICVRPHLPGTDNCLTWQGYFLFLKVKK